MMDFPLDGLTDEQACYDRLVPLLHPDGLACPAAAAPMPASTAATAPQFSTTAAPSAGP